MTDSAGSIPVAGVRRLGQSYGPRQVIQDVSFDVRAGECFALVGPNGAGKTTLLEVVLGLRQPTRGTAHVFGGDPRRRDHRWREKVGAVIDGTNVDPESTVREALSRFAHFYSKADPDAALTLTGLRAHGHVRVVALSAGERQRLRLALALLGRPELLVLDEPTSGFDPVVRRVMWEAIACLRDAGAAVLLATQAFEEAELLADRVGILGAGRLLDEGSPARLVTDLPSRISFTIATGQAPCVPFDLAQRAEQVNGRWQLATSTPRADLAALVDWAQTTGADLPELEVRRARLEDAYLRLHVSGSELEERSCDQRHG